jgi:hypothetical protein
MLDQLKEKAKFFCSHVASQFLARTNVEGKKHGISYGVNLDISLKGVVLFFTFKKGEEIYTFTIPMPFVEDGVLLIEQNEVRRAVCEFFFRERDLVVDYFAAMGRVIFDNPVGIIPAAFIKKVSFLQQIVYSFENKNTSAIIYNLQRAINEVVNKFPLYETQMKAWAMNKRLVIVDPMFDALRGPEARLHYQVEKNRAYFDRGWTSIGLSDGTLADKNYILTEDLRKLTPLGMKYHNPQRNLFSTLGMKGDELPLVRSESMQKLMDKGITRKGWNLFTVFVDVLDVFEDQIVVDKKHRGKFITLTKRYQCFGVMSVKVGEIINKGTTLSISDLGVPKKCDVEADKVRVTKIADTFVNVGGVPTPAFNVVVEYKRYLRDGVKMTNLHGNKGVIHMQDLGKAIDPRTGELRQIDVIVSARSVKKRKNFGQLFEAMANNIWPDDKKPLVFTDEAEINLNNLKTKLVECGLPDDGTWMCNTYVGQLTGIAGKVFWGVTASVENALWDEEDTVRVNNRLLRTAGLKFSHVEQRALKTRFGDNNPIYAEVMSYAQGGHDLHETLRILNSKREVLPNNMPEVSFKDIKAVDQSKGTIFDRNKIEGTIVDEFIYHNGFILELPVNYCAMVDGTGKVVHEGVNSGFAPANVVKTYNFTKIYIPNASLRRCWQHDTGKYGLSEVGVLLNNLVIMCHRYAAEPNNAIHLTQLYRSIYTYFSKISKMMGTKRGDISTLGMSVRYPFSAKAVATLSNRLPENTIEIHESMAKTLGVSNGDVVLVERFPCLGFMSVRPQKVHVSKDEMCRYTIRVSGNNLCSLGLDFDGDVIFVASFHTPESKALLRKEWNNPQKDCYGVICRLNEKAGVPHIDCLVLDDYNIVPFKKVTNEAHADMVEKATGVKAHTGPVIALAYNLMRIIENSLLANDQQVNIAAEVFLDRVGNTVFKQKHGVKSLHSIVVDAICTGNVETLVKHEFDRETSQTICDLVRAKGREIGVHDLEKYHKKAKERGWSNVINLIVRKQNRIYFASRASLETIELLTALDSPAVDMPSTIYHNMLMGKSEHKRTLMDECLDKKMVERLNSANSKEAAQELFKILDVLFEPNEEEKRASIQEYFKKSQEMFKEKHVDAELIVVEGLYNPGKII